jgi:toxin ParE1/3/4
LAYHIKWTLKALNDLRDVHEYIAKDSTRYAAIQIESILNSISNLSAFPLLGRQTPEFPKLPYRELISGNYRVLYRVIEEESVILIMAVAHGRMLLRGQL